MPDNLTATVDSNLVTKTEIKILINEISRTRNLLQNRMTGEGVNRPDGCIGQHRLIATVPTRYT